MLNMISDAPEFGNLIEFPTVEIHVRSPEFVDHGWDVGMAPQRVWINLFESHLQYQLNSLREIQDSFPQGARVRLAAGVGGTHQDPWLLRRFRSN